MRLPIGILVAYGLWACGQSSRTQHAGAGGSAGLAGSNIGGADAGAPNAGGTTGGIAGNVGSGGSVTAGTGGAAGQSNLDGGLTPLQICNTVMGPACFSSTQAGDCQWANPGPAGAVPVRECPPGSTCADGHCQPPAGSISCTRASDCSAGRSCNLYVTGPSAVGGFCTEPFPTDASSDQFLECSSTEGLIDHNPTCATGLCVSAYIADVLTSQCLWLCTEAADCPGGTCTEVLGHPFEGMGLGTGTRSCFR